MENQVIQDSRGKKLEEGKGATPSKRRGKTQIAERCVKESWPRKKKRKSGTIGLTIYGS
jgi:hypothetical protein